MSVHVSIVVVTVYFILFYFWGKLILRDCDHSNWHEGGEFHPLDHGRGSVTVLDGSQLSPTYDMGWPAGDLQDIFDLD